MTMLAATWAVLSGNCFRELAESKEPVMEFIM